MGCTEECLPLRRQVAYPPLSLYLFLCLHVSDFKEVCVCLFCFACLLGFVLWICLFVCGGFCLFGFWLACLFFLESANGATVSEVRE